jgi:hypothetical protein
MFNVYSDGTQSSDEWEEDFEQEITTGFAVKSYDEDGSNSEMTFYPCKVNFTNWEANEEEVLEQIKQDFPPSDYQNNEW